MHSRRAVEIVWLIGLLILAAGLRVPTARGEALFVRGEVTGIWSAPIDTVVIDSFAWVPAAETLQIAPGMVVAFSGRFSLLVNGTLLANGEGDDSIFVQSIPYHDSNGHLGIRFYETTTISRLNKVKFEDGFANSGNFERYGGALELYFSEVEIDSCLFQGNRARIDGGAIYCREAGTLTVRASEFEGDSTRFGGGGAILARTSGYVRLTRCRFTNNAAAVSGGAVTSESGVVVELDSCYFANNFAVNKAGGLYLWSTPPASWIRNCVIEECVADQGGGIFTDNCRATIDGCTIRNCFARLGGGLGARRSNNLTTLSHTTITGNAANEDGGGLYITEAARCTVENCLIANNTATRGGGIFTVASTSPTIRFTTFAGNIAQGGSALDFYGGGEIYNSIVTGETGDALVNYGATASPTVSYTNIFSNSVPELSGVHPEWLLENTRMNVALVECDSLRNISFDPQFVNSDSGDFNLSDISPCLFGADTSYSSGADLAGNPRVSPQGSWPDMGAYENDAPLPYFQNCGPQRGVWFPGEYVVGCSLRVETSDTLVLMGGATLLFAPGAGLYVEGTLLAMGTAHDSIVFDRYFDLPDATWNGISLASSTTNSRLNYCSVRHVVGASALTTSEPATQLNHCTFSLNEHVGGGGGAASALQNSSPVFTRCTFKQNRATTGGAVSALTGHIDFRGCLFDHNEAVNFGAPFTALGGAVKCENGSFSECLFVSNTAYEGGGVALDHTGIFTDCEFDSCAAWKGGGLSLGGGTAELYRVEFRGNQGKDFGGAVCMGEAVLSDSGSFYIGNRGANGGAIANLHGGYSGTDTEYSDNSADNEGGVIWLGNDRAALFFTCTLHRNHAKTGGAVWGDAAGIDFFRCLLDSNYATEATGGIYLLGGGVSFLRSTVVNHHSPGQGTVVQNRFNSVLWCNSTLFAENGDSPISVHSGVQNDFRYSMSDVLIVAGDDSIGFPSRVNFNGDSCDADLNLVAEPLFVDYAARDYRLQSESKAVQAADSLLPLDDDGTRADIGLYPGIRPYLLLQPFNLAWPERNAYFHPGDTVAFAWNSSWDGDPGDEIDYSLHLHSESFDTAITTGSELGHTVILHNGQYEWWVVAASHQPETELESFERRTFVVTDPDLGLDDVLWPREFSVSMDGPNPFNSATRLRITLPHSTEVTVTLVNVLGRTSFAIREREFVAGVHSISIDGTRLGSGVYWAHVKTSLGTKTLQLHLIK